MVKVKAFRGLRPKASLVERVAAPPYDTLSSEEAREMASANEHSFLRVTKPEITFDPSEDLSKVDLYRRAKENLQALIDNESMIRDEKNSIYIYRLNWRDVEQTGYMLLSAVDDYLKGAIKRHEFTRPDKESDRTRLSDVLNAQPGPVFLFYPPNNNLDKLLESTTGGEPKFDFVAADVRHRIWIIDDPKLVADIVAGFAGIKATYIADGHHRCAAAANVCKERRGANPGFSGQEPFNFFLTVIFPENQLRILPYNRVVTDLNGLSVADFVGKVSERFEVTPSPDNKPVDPEAEEAIGMYIDGKWYRLVPGPNSYNQHDPIESLHISILSKNLLEPLLGISKPRTDKRIDFVGGIRGTRELVKLVDSGRFAVAFAVPAVTLKALRDVADKDGIMPPKSTWFEPKLRSGLVVNLLNE